MKLATWAPLLAYPAADYHARAQEGAAVAPSPEMEQFLRNIGEVPVEALQELYSQNFDWDPDRTLDISWHVFGENYDRGALLVKIRELLRQYGIAESHELPDHLSHVLPLLDSMPENERVEFAAKYLQPALEKLHAGLAKAESPFLPLIDSLRGEVAALVPESISLGVKDE
ncbi:MAG: nitrate reductase molybdenum cofactor assembly chaperone [Bryobacterales bacterium]|nr:nitrate reductase molybdenum cofactor assembly chaperone [Bryobacterales bacterium]